MVKDLIRRGEVALSKLREQMPELRFRGILIAMYFNDHAPQHFHVRATAASGGQDRH